MRRSYAAVLAAVLVTTVACSSEAKPDAPSPSSSEPSSVAPTASVTSAWSAEVKVRPDWVGKDAPWLWEYSDDVVVLAPRGLVALDLETGLERWRLPLGGPVCGATPTRSKVGLMAVIVGTCRPASTPTRGGSQIATGDAATARRTTLKVVDLESASIVWEKPLPGAPLLEIGGEAVLAVDGCRSRRFQLSDGTALGRLELGCSDGIMADDGVAVVSRAKAPNRWRAIDIETGALVAEATGPATMTEPRRIVAADPLTVLAGSTVDDQLDLVGVSDDAVRVLGQVPSGNVLAASAESAVFVDESGNGALEISLSDGSTERELADVDAEQWLPFDLLDGEILGFEGTSEELDSGHGSLTLRSLSDGAVTRVGDFGGTDSLGDTNLVVAGTKAVVLGDLLLMSGHGNGGVLAYRLVLP